METTLSSTSILNRLSEQSVRNSEQNNGQFSLELQQNQELAAFLSEDCQACWKLGHTTINKQSSDVVPCSAVLQR